MAYDERLAERIRGLLLSEDNVGERKMFGGVCFMVNGHMSCGVTDKDLMLRLGEEGAADALEERHTRPMDFTGKPLKTLVYVVPAGIRTAPALRKWVTRAVNYANSLPPKKQRSARNATTRKPIGKKLGKAKRTTTSTLKARGSRSRSSRTY